MNVTTKQLLTLLLMTLTMAVILALLPEQPVNRDQANVPASLVSQISE